MARISANNLEISVHYVLMYVDEEFVQSSSVFLVKYRKLLKLWPINFGNKESF